MEPITVNVTQDGYTAFLHSVGIKFERNDAHFPSIRSMLQYVVRAFSTERPSVRAGVLNSLDEEEGAINA
jgi:hypothetical protein